jgi:hypothetical protein
MQRFTFETYKADAGHPPEDQIMWELPGEFLGQRDVLVRQAGLDPSQIQEAGLLTAPWGRHPKRAIILAPAVDFTPGDVFAVSREAIPSTSLE